MCSLTVVADELLVGIIEGGNLRRSVILRNQQDLVREGSGGGEVIGRNSWCGAGQGRIECKPKVGKAQGRHADLL